MIGADIGGMSASTVTTLTVYDAFGGERDEPDQIH